MAHQLLPTAVVKLSPPKRLFDCAADCPKSHGYVHTLGGDSAPWLLALRTETPLPCGHPVCVECIAARPVVMVQCARCNMRHDRHAKRARRQMQPAPLSHQTHCPSSSSPPKAVAQPSAPSSAGAVPYGERAAGLSSVAEAFFQRAPSTADGTYAYEVGESCLLPDDTYIPGSYFEVRVVDRRRGQEGYDTEYLVHFIGWKSRYDKWLGASALVPLTQIVGEGSPSGAALIGRRVGCWWRDDKRWFCGHVVAYREQGNGPVSVGGGGAFGAVRIRYDDGEALWEPLPPATRPLQEMTMRLQPSAAEHALIRLGRNRAAGARDDAIPLARAEPTHQVEEQNDQAGNLMRVTRAKTKAAEPSHTDRDGHGPTVDSGRAQEIEEHVIASEDDDHDNQDEWLTTGSRWIGRRIRRSFPGVPTVVGRVVSWLPPTRTDPALWRLRHEDGDEEDLEEYELKEGSAAYGRGRK